MAPVALLKASGVHSFMSWDHDRLDTLLGHVSRLVEGGQLERAARRFDDFALGLEREMRLEEELLFPLFDARVGVTTGPTTALRQEHRLMARSVGRMRVALAEADPAGFHAAHDALMNVITYHDMKEERVIFAALDRALAPGERAELLARIARR